MALFVILKSLNAKGKPNIVEGHIPFRDLPTLLNEKIDYIQVDGDELVLLVDTFTSTCGEITIPVAYGNDGLMKRVQCWYGSLAKTIYYNLRNS